MKHFHDSVISVKAMSVEGTKLISGILILIVLAKFIFNASIFGIFMQPPTHSPYCQECGRFCGLWKCITVNLENGETLNNLDAFFQIKRIEFVVNTLFLAIELILVASLLIYYGRRERRDRTNHLHSCDEQNPGVKFV